MTTVLGIDVGSSTIKVTAVSLADVVVEGTVSRCGTPDAADALLDATADAVRACVARTVEPIAAIGIASMAETGVPVDAAGAALTPLIRWNRTSSRSVLAAVMLRHPVLPARTGIPATPKPTLLSLIALSEDAPDVFARMTRWLGIADLVAWALTGSHATDHTLAARTMMLDHGEWDAMLLEEAGVGADVMPRIVDPGAAAGVTGDSAAAFGLGRGIPVFIAGHDHVVGAWAVGAREPGSVADSLGTAEAVIRIAGEVDAAAATADGFSVGRTVDGRHATVLGGNPACGSLLAAWPSNCGLGLASSAGPTPAEVLTAADPHAWSTSPVAVAPYPFGRQCPQPDPDATLTTPPGTGRTELAPALLQGIVLQARWMRERMAAHIGGSSGDTVLFGSLADHIPAWAPLVAAANHTRLRRCTATEPVAAGAALLAAVRAGLAPAESTLPTASVSAADAPGIDEAYRRFLDVVGAEPIEGEL